MSPNLDSNPCYDTLSAIAYTAVQNGVMQKFKSCKISIANVSFSSLVYLNIVLYMLTISFLQKNIVKLGKEKPNIEFILVGLS